MMRCLDVRSIPAGFSLMAGLAVAVPVVEAQDFTTPADWRWRLDRPASLVTGEEVPDSAWRFVGMPPGWHVTTGPAVVLFHPLERASGRYTLSSDFVLFPGPSASPYGLILGGANLASADSVSVSVQLRRDGAVRVVAKRAGRQEELVAWRPHAAIRPHPGPGTVTNRIRVSVATDSLRVFVNDSTVASVSASGLRLDGQYGFLVGERLNMHITTLDHTRHLAPHRGR